ncbi:hypothetical protein [Cellulomonas oligotrophica]|uniref:Major facilitator superfamily (MFS) profile domain-containing protein n=1 Tax=Cellulomonas oligotrophica TaxID=931536 RepID=A0A7Y9FIH9_9CELL|nr:hypothetical protein [Cellulomonas oligotrophica]NYD87900.1 hypothetical protein [Cellulomonas oligotrophica]GIG32893.1 hypothetical protein Col01nite_20520 [Cellulomonas oligotrophica]
MDDDRRTTSDQVGPDPGRVVGAVLAFAAFVGAFALLTLGFTLEGTTGMVVVGAGIVLFGLAYAIPMGVMPALEDRAARG